MAMKSLVSQEYLNSSLRLPVAWTAEQESLSVAVGVWTASRLELVLD